MTVTYKVWIVTLAMRCAKTLQTGTPSRKFLLNTQTATEEQHARVGREARGARRIASCSAWIRPHTLREPSREGRTCESAYKLWAPKILASRMVALTLVFSGMLVCWGLALIHTNQTKDASMASAIANAQRLVERMQQRLEATIDSYASYALAACQLLAGRTARHRQLLLGSYLSFLDQRIPDPLDLLESVVYLAQHRVAPFAVSMRDSWASMSTSRKAATTYVLALHLALALLLLSTPSPSPPPFPPPSPPSAPPLMVASPPSPPVSPQPYGLRPGMRTALLIRGYNPTDSMLRRWTAFARSCRRASPPVLLSISLDVTNRSASADVARLADVAAEGALIHTYTEAAVLRTFPGLPLLAAKYTELTHKPYRYGRYAIIEPILLWHDWLVEHHRAQAQLLQQQQQERKEGERKQREQQEQREQLLQEQRRRQRRQAPQSSERHHRFSLWRRMSGAAAEPRDVAHLGPSNTRPRHEKQKALVSLQGERAPQHETLELPEHIWIFEQDVAASAPEHLAGRLLAAYSQNLADLITAMPINETKFAQKILNQGSAGFHAAVQSPAFAAAFPKETHMWSLRVAPLFVQRWSHRLVRTLRKATKTHLMHAWFEIATPTLCRRANLTMSNVQAAHRGSLFHACCTKHVKKTSQNFLPDERRFNYRIPQNVTKLYHPVKF